MIGVLYIIYGEYYTLHQDILIRLPWEIDAVGVTMLFYGVGGLISKIGRISFNKILVKQYYFILLHGFFNICLTKQELTITKR